MRLEDYEALLNSVADQVSAPDYFPDNMPENDLHPDPRALRDEIVTLRHRMDRLEKIVGNGFIAKREEPQILGTQHVIREFPRRY